MTREPDDLQCAVYLSHACEGVGDDDLVDIVRRAQPRNEAAGITGGLVLLRGRFIQVLEGPAPALQSCLSRIALDPRHERMQVLRTAPIGVRRFDGWGMRGVRNVGPQPAAVEGFLTRVEAGVDPRDIHRVIELVASLLERAAEPA